LDFKNNTFETYMGVSPMELVALTSQPWLSKSSQVFLDPDKAAQ
jgi:hypothetical protein